MIQQKDLRTGNLVLIPLLGDGFYEMHTINRFGRECYVTGHKDGYLSGRIDIENVFPVFLSKEIIIKLGFIPKPLYGWKGNGADYQPETSKTECEDFVLDGICFIRLEKNSYRKSENDDWIDETEKLKIYFNQWYEKCTEGNIHYADWLHDLQNIYYIEQKEDLIIKL